MAESQDTSMFNYWKNCQTVSQGVCIISHYLQQRYESSTCSTTLPKGGRINFYNFSHSYRYEVAFHYGLTCISLLSDHVRSIVSPILL